MLFAPLLAPWPRTPLVISGAAEDTSKIYTQIARFIPELKQQEVSEDEEGNKVIKEEGHFLIDEKSRQVELTELGHDHVEKLLQSADMLNEQKSLYSSMRKEPRLKSLLFQELDPE